MRIGTVGTSGITELFISAAKKQGLQFTAACSRDETRARTFAEKHGMEYAFRDIGEMAASGCIDAVYIASPNSCHFSQSSLFLENGKHVLCEKPMCTTEQEQLALHSISDRKGLICAEAIMSVHTPAFGILKERIKQIGAIRTANFVFCQRSSRYDAYLGGALPNIFNPALHAGCLMDIGVYNVYLAAALFGEPDSIRSDAVFLKSGADAAGSAILTYGDLLANLSYSKVGQSFAPSEIVGDAGTIQIGSVSQLTGVTLLSTAGLRTELVEPNLTRDEVMGGEARFFMGAASGDNTEEYKFARDTALTVRRICDTIRKQNHFPF